MDKKIQLSILSIFLAAALIGSVVAYADNMAYAGGKNKKSNDAVQIIRQLSGTQESSVCEAGKNIKASCNNVAFTANFNKGNNVLAQK
jgi:hypothetical protein